MRIARSEASVPDQMPFPAVPTRSAENATRPASFAETSWKASIVRPNGSLGASSPLIDSLVIGPPLLTLQTERVLKAFGSAIESGPVLLPKIVLPNELTRVTVEKRFPQIVGCPRPGTYPAGSGSPP